MQRDLIWPLQQWALASADPVVRNAGTELATISALLHRLSPSLQEVLVARLGNAGPADGELVPAKLFQQYLQLSGRFAGLMKALWQWRKQPVAGA